MTERDLREVYEGRVFYGRDAFEGLHTLDKLIAFKRECSVDPDLRNVVRSLKFVTSTTSVFPSQRPRESPIHWRILESRCGRPSIGITRASCSRS